MAMLCKEGCQPSLISYLISGLFGPVLGFFFGSISSFSNTKLLASFTTVSYLRKILKVWTLYHNPIMHFKARHVRFYIIGFVFIAQLTASVVTDNSSKLPRQEQVTQFLRRYFHGCEFVIVMR